MTVHDKRLDFSSDKIHGASRSLKEAKMGWVFIIFFKLFMEKSRKIAIQLCCALYIRYILLTLAHSLCSYVPYITREEFQSSITPLGILNKGWDGRSPAGTTNTSSKIPPFLRGNNDENSDFCVPSNLTSR